MKPRTVVWRDAYALPETWICHDHRFDPPVIVTTVGFVLKGGPKGDYVVVADSTYVTGGQRFYGGVTVIPSAMVVSIT